MRSDEIETQLANTTDPVTKIDLLNQLAFEYQYNDLEKATAVAEKAQEVVNKLEKAKTPYLKGKADTLQTLGYLHLRQHSNGLKMPLLLEALALYQELNHHTGEARTLIYIGLTYLRIGHYDESLVYLKRSLEISKLNHNEAEISRAYNGLGLIYQVTQKYDVALHYYQESIEISRKLNDLQQVAITLSNCASTAENIGQYEDAIAFGEECITLSRLVGNQVSEGYALLGIVRARMRQGEHQTALQLLQENSHRLVTSPDHYLTISNMIVIGTVYHELQRIDDAIAIWQQALQIADQTGLPELGCACHENLSRIFKEQGDFVSALAHYEQFHQLKELIYDERTNSRLQALAVIHRTETAQAEAQILQAANDELTSEIQVRKRVESELRFYQNQLEELVFARTAALEEANSKLRAEINDRQQIQAEREEMIVELEVKHAELERFTYTVSHDLKSPLVTIEGFLGYLEQDALQGNQTSLMEDINHIRHAAQQMHVLLGDLLELSRVGRIVNPLEWISFSDLANEASLRLRHKLVEKEIHLEIAPDCPLVYVDRPRLVEVLQNLLDNSIKFMGEQADPRIVIGVRYDDGRVFFVQDNGIGIASAYQNKIFGLFERLNQSGEGTGIGLALVKRIVEVHNGRLWVESAGPGQGSTFCFTLNETTTKIKD
ncbi:MAG: tetratricopeptide repeat protein [Anaerolineae bacterium]|nr:tetratricopeptide repeat protein [Anaerolineae bacterium]